MKELGTFFSLAGGFMTGFGLSEVAKLGHGGLVILIAVGVILLIVGSVMQLLLNR